MLLSVWLTGPMSGRSVARCIAEALGVDDSVPQFIGTDRWEIEVLLPDDVVSDEDGTAAEWELLCAVVSGESADVVAPDLDRLKRALLDGGASDVVVEHLEA